MRVMHSLALTCASLALAFGAAAQQNPAPKPANAAAKPAKAAAKPGGKAAAAAAAVPTLAVADAEQLLAAEQAYLGAYHCEFKQTLSVAKHQVAGYMVVTFSSKAYTMKPVRSSTGAVRLEEVGNGPMLMVQIPTKSMLMDTVRGRRIVDACVHEVQAKEALADGNTNALGMNMAGQVNTGSSCPAGTARC